MPDTIYTIKEYAFSQCKNLNHIIIPNDVREIESHAFSQCENLKTITFLGDAPKNVSNVSNVFKGSEPILYRTKNSIGWKQLWSGRPVRLLSEKNKN